MKRISIKSIYYAGEYELEDNNGHISKVVLNKSQARAMFQKYFELGFKKIEFKGEF